MSRHIFSWYILVLVISLFLDPFIELDADELSFQVRVNAGSKERILTPVFIDLEIPSGFQANNAQLEYGGDLISGQVEVLSPEVIRVWWIVDGLEAHQNRVYDLSLNDEVIENYRFRWEDSSVLNVQSTDLKYDDRSVLRYMHTAFDGNDIESTKKPFHHVFDVHGETFITKGVGGRFSHHRGIFFGYQECQVGNRSFDTWHARDGEHQEHIEFKSTQQGDVFGEQTSIISWNDRQGQPFALEERQFRVFDQADNQLLIDITSVLVTTGSQVELAGDRQHAGLQFRAAQEVAENESATQFLRPAGWSHLSASQEVNNSAHKDLPWNAMQFEIGGETYTITYLSHLDNPNDAEFSERRYGRFGEYFPWSLRQDNPLTLKYRFWITTHGEVSRSEVQQKYEDYINPPEVTIVKNQFIRGDVDRNGSPGFSDAIHLLRAMFGEPLTSVPDCWDSADINDDGRVNLSDAMFSLFSIFVPKFSEIPAPYPSCGIDPTEDSLSCSHLTCS